MVYPPTGSTTKDREMSSHAYVPSGCGTVYLTSHCHGGFMEFCKLTSMLSGATLQFILCLRLSLMCIAEIFLVVVLVDSDMLNVGSLCTMAYHSSMMSRKMSYDNTSSVTLSRMPLIGIICLLLRLQLAIVMNFLFTAAVNSSDVYRKIMK